MNKEELIKFIGEKANLSEKDATSALESVTKSIQKNLEEKYKNIPSDKAINGIKEEIDNIDKQLEELEDEG